MCISEAAKYQVNNLLDAFQIWCLRVEVLGHVFPCQLRESASLQSELLQYLIHFWSIDGWIALADSMVTSKLGILTADTFEYMVSKCGASVRRRDRGQ